MKVATKKNQKIRAKNEGKWRIGKENRIANSNEKM